MRCDGEGKWAGGRETTKFTHADTGWPRVMKSTKFTQFESVICLRDAKCISIVFQNFPLLANPKKMPAILLFLRHSGRETDRLTNRVR